MKKISVHDMREMLGISSEARLLDIMKSLFELADVSELEMLGESGPLFASGGKKSLFMALFGRDSIKTSLDLIRYHPEVAHRTVIALAELQGTRLDNDSEEEEGKILHEYRPMHDPIRKKLEKRFKFPYYGSVDSTPLFVYLVCIYALRSPEFLQEKIVNKDGRKISIKQSLVRAVKFLIRKMEESPDGLLEWKRLNPQGHLNQAWKDSFDAYHHSDGTLANHDEEIAGIEVQGYLHNALRKVIDLFSAFEIDPIKLGLPPVDELIKMRNGLSRKVISEFWMPKNMYFAIGLDRHNKKYHKLDIITSNPGHLLETEIFHENPHGTKFVEAIVKKLFSKELLTHVGIRTLSDRMKRYQPSRYHNGTVWPFDNGVIADGLRRYGYAVLANEIEYRVLRAIHEVGSNVEFFRGDSDRIPKINTKVVSGRAEDGHIHNFEQPPQMNQAWTATRAYIIERRYAEDFYLKTKYRPKDEFEKGIILDLKKRGELFTKPVDI